MCYGTKSTGERTVEISAPRHQSQLEGSSLLLQQIKSASTHSASLLCQSCVLETGLI